MLSNAPVQDFAQCRSIFLPGLSFKTIVLEVNTIVKESPAFMPQLCRVKILKQDTF